LITYDKVYMPGSGRFLGMTHKMGLWPNWPTVNDQRTHAWSGAQQYNETQWRHCAPLCVLYWGCFTRSIK